MPRLPRPVEEAQDVDAGHPRGGKKIRRWAGPRPMRRAERKYKYKGLGVLLPVGCTPTGVLSQPLPLTPPHPSPARWWNRNIKPSPSRVLSSSRFGAPCWAKPCRKYKYKGLGVLLPVGCTPTGVFLQGTREGGTTEEPFKPGPD